MMRRLIPNPARRPCCRKISMKQKSLDPYTSIGTCRYSSNDAAIRSQIEGDTSTARFTSAPILPSSRGFEIKGIPTRQLSSEAIHALSPRGNQDFFGSSSHTGQDVMMMPSLSSIEGKPEDSIAFLPLFKAISTLNRQSPSTDISILDVENVGGTESCDHEEDKLDINGTAATIETDEEVKEIQSQEIVTESQEIVTDPEQEKHRMSCDLGLALQHNPHHPLRYEKVMQLFEEAQTSPHELLENKQIISIFYYLVKTDVSAGFDVLKYYKTRCEEQGRLVGLDMYHRLVNRIRSVELQFKATHYKPKSKTRQMTFDELQKLVGDITEHIKEEYSDGKKMVYQYLLLPELVVSLTCHPNPYVNRSAKPIMDYILETQFPQLNPELYEHLLGMATQNRAGFDFLPYNRVLSQLVSSGHRPKPETVIGVLRSYHPFVDIEATHEVLAIIQKLSSPSVAEDYSVELGTLESISMASARKNIELNLLVWDMAEMFGYNPTESMFEDVIMSFGATRQDENMYSALVDMEKHDFVPSRVLLRYVALKVAYHQKRLDHSNKMLSWTENEHMRSTHTMNALMMGYGIKKDINSAFRVFEDLEKFNLKPDADTFSFLMEILYIDTKERFPYQASMPPRYNKEDVDDVVGASQIVLGAMEEAGILKTKHIYHEHIRLLCALGLLEDANLVLEEALSTRTPVPVASLFMIATRFADRGDFDMALGVAELSVEAGCGELPQLVNRINNIKSPKQWTKGKLRTPEPELEPESPS